jgi:hypothetical protein
MPPDRQLIPADLGNPQAAPRVAWIRHLLRKTTHSPWNQMQPFAAHFLAGIKQQLHSDTDAQQGHPPLDSGEKRLLKPLPAQVVDTAAKGPLSRQHDGPPTGQIGRPFDDIHRNGSGAATCSNAL